MCGIIGYTGKRDAAKILLQGLSALEYRGYDSAGISVAEEDGIHTVKCPGRVSELQRLIESETGFSGHCGIGHTRWATHGMPTAENAHPHFSKSLVLVHNGIIENDLELHRMLAAEGYTFVSETDTECAAHLLDSLYQKHHDPSATLREASKMLTGSFALGILFRDRPGEIWAIRRDSPLIVAWEEGDGAYLASDIPALLSHTRNIYRLGENEMACLRADGIVFYAPDGRETQKTAETIDWNVDAAEKNGYAHFMLKEIHEEPDAVRRTARHRVNSSRLPDFSADDIEEDFWHGIDSVSIVGCGSAMHAGLIGRMLIERLAGIPVTVDLASEYRYQPPATIGKTLMIPISQSGETADTLAALRLARKHGLTSLGIINVVGSAIAREADRVMYTGAGPEIAVATTKGYTTQLAALCMIAVKLALVRDRMSIDEVRAFCGAMTETLPALISQIIEARSQIAKLAVEIAPYDNLFYIGRGVDYPSAFECSLKLKEISYIHSEAYAAGELKHGTLSLVTEGTPVITLATDARYFDKMIGNIREVRSRGGHVILVCTADFAAPEEYAESVFVLPEPKTPLPPFLTSFLTVVFAQLLAYETAILRDCDVDHPRNLAKSVTVE